MFFFSSDYLYIHWKRKWKGTLLKIPSKSELMITSSEMHLDEGCNLDRSDKVVRLLSEWAGQKDSLLNTINSNIFQIFFEIPKNFRLYESHQFLGLPIKARICSLWEQFITLVRSIWILRWEIKNSMILRFDLHWMMYSKIPILKPPLGLSKSGL